MSRVLALKFDLFNAGRSRMHYITQKASLETRIDLRVGQIRFFQRPLP